MYVVMVGTVDLVGVCSHAWWGLWTSWVYVVMVGIVDLMGVCSHGGDCGPHGCM